MTWMEYLIGVATLAALFVSGFTLVQVKRQTDLMRRPEVVADICGDLSVAVPHPEGLDLMYELSQIDFDNLIDSVIRKADPSLCLLNVGQGTAVDFNWRYSNYSRDLEGLMKGVLYGNRKDVYQYLPESDAIIWGSIIFRPTMSGSKSFLPVVHYINDNNELDISLFVKLELIKWLSYISMNRNSENLEDEIKNLFSDLPNLELSYSYKDIFDNTYEGYCFIHIVPKRLSLRESEFQIELKLDKHRIHDSDLTVQLDGTRFAIFDMME